VVLAQLFDRFTRVVDALPRTRVPRLVLEMGLLDLVHSEPLMPLGDLIDRLEQISTGNSPGGSGPRGGSFPSRESRPAMPARTEPPARTSAPPARPEPTASTPASTPASVPRDVPDSPFSKFLAPLMTANDSGRVAEPPPRPAEPASRPREISQRTSAESGPPDDPPWPSGMAATSRPPASADIQPAPRPTPPVSSQSPPSPPPKSAEPAPQPAEEDCQACPGSPRPEAADIIPWSTMPPFTAWEALLERVRVADPPLFALIADLGLCQLADGVLRLGGNTFARNQLRDQPQFRSGLEFLLHQHLGAPFRLELVDTEPSLPDFPSYALIEASRQEALQRDVLREAQANPQIQSLMAQFDAQLRSVRPRGAPRP
jgi:DNA polymerase-3 subunit gamma/tau